jgi:phytoene desaturase
VRTVSGPTDRVVIVGAGLGGLSAALRLAGAGRQVTLLERADTPGGRCGVLRTGGYTFDTGPTVLTMPDLIADALDCVGERLEDWLELRPVSPLYRARYADGSSLDVLADAEEMTEEVRRVCGGESAAGYRRYVDFVSRLYRYEMRDFIDRNIDRPTDLITSNLARLAAIGGFRRLAPKVASYLPDPRLQKVLSFQAMYAGLSPYEALAIYAVIAYMDSVAGVFFPVGGMHALPVALAGAAEKHGVEIRYGTEVARLETRHGRAVAAITSAGERIPADVFVLNPDLPIAYRDLLPAGSTPRRVQRQRYSPSCAVLLAGSRANYGGGAHHNIHFGTAWRGVFDEIIEQGALMSDPSFLVTNPTHSDPALAPIDRESYYVLFPTPNLRGGQDWTTLGPRYRDQMVATLESRGYHGFGDAIEVEQLTTPADWAARGMAAGAPFAATHSFFQTGPFRASNLCPTVDGVVFVGSGTQPGVGVPMVLISGRLAAERITGPDRAYRSRAQRSGVAPTARWRPPRQGGGGRPPR